MIVLAVLSLVGGFLELPEALGHVRLFSDFMHGSLPAVVLASGRQGQEGLFTIMSGLVSVGGILLIVVLLRPAAGLTRAAAASPVGAALHRWWFGGWGFDGLYDFLVVRPYVRLAILDRDDVIDGLFRGIGALAQWGHRTLAVTQTGLIRSYVAAVAWGAVIVLGLAVLL
jgi:NADH-quinone oxidoreductase subunit L